MKLTQKTIAALTLAEGKTEAIIFDSDLPGFGIRIRARQPHVDLSIQDRQSESARHARLAGGPDAGMRT